MSLFVTLSPRLAARVATRLRQRCRELQRRLDNSGTDTDPGVAPDNMTNSLDGSGIVCAPGPDRPLVSLSDVPPGTTALVLCFQDFLRLLDRSIDDGRSFFEHSDLERGPIVHAGERINGGRKNPGRKEAKELTFSQFADKYWPKLRVVGATNTSSRAGTGVDTKSAGGGAGGAKSKAGGGTKTVADLDFDVYKEILLIKACRVPESGGSERFVKNTPALPGSSPHYSETDRARIYAMYEAYEKLKSDAQQWDACDAAFQILRRDAERRQEQNSVG